MTPKKMQQTICEVLKDNKGQNVSVFDVRKLTDITDYMVIASGTSVRHGQTMADKLIDDMRGKGVKALGVEGRDTGEWVLLDFGDVVVHIMRPQTREFYNLEKLWGEGMKAGVVE